MKFLRPTLRKHLTYGAYAVALVCSLALYQRVFTKPLSVGEQQAGAIAAKDKNHPNAQYSHKVVGLSAVGRNLIKQVSLLMHYGGSTPNSVSKIDRIAVFSGKFDEI